MSIEERKVRRKIDKLFSGRDSVWLEKTTGEFGDENGVVLTDTEGMVNVRTRDGQVHQVYNAVAPEDPNIKVLIGKSKDQPTLWQVIAWRDAYQKPQAPRVKYHHKQHEFTGPDRVHIDRKQVLQLTVLVKSGDDFTVQVFGGSIITPTGPGLVKTTILDLSSYVPSTGAVFIGIETDQSGELSVHEGDAFAAPAAATAADYPIPESGKYLVGWVLLFENQEELLDAHVYVPIPLGVNFVDLDTGTQIHDAEEETTLADDDEFGFWQAASETIKKVTWVNIVAALTAIFDTLYAALNHTHPDPPVQLHGLARWNGASGQTTFDLPDVWESIDSVMINGLEEDPLVYTLSSNRAQIVLDTALASASTVTAHGVIAMLS